MRLIWTFFYVSHKERNPFFISSDQWRGGYSFLGVAKSILAPLLCNVCLLNVTQVGELDNG